MKTLFLLVGIFSAIVTLPVFSNDLIDETMSGEGVSKVYVENMRGEVAIKGWDKNQVLVKGKLDEHAKALDFNKNGSVIDIKVRMKNHHNYRNNDGSDLVIMVPKRMRVEFSGVSSDFNLESISKGIEGKTVSGDIDIRDIDHQIEISTVSGDIKSINAKGKVTMTTVSGEISDKASSGRLQLRAVSGEIDTQSNATEVDLGVVSGDLTFSLATVDELELSSVSGEIEGELALADNGRVKMSSVSGDIALKFTADVNASFRLKTHAGGDLINHITSDKAVESKYSPRAKLNFEAGNGSATVKATTVSGTIRLFK
ncbi:DUF4097 family beta strand repeat-containing protein [Thalassotalea sp. 1_MG-2023]|uniref:DUF4097 family beta strand repeat-containing protein n=1 Tax=Thalassotalea sp. 1_MG-2023 TaxID=3062680 RepID=UPI0026E1B2A0|nr:DUF4097 family beta strand repeat-containing protein [Thalassotalea sp. 1_MG-2023]MDO6426184.1 DUF4097 family beta strand repeat-containing protein [Thalassotalea sp. 1_MG-2023]